MGEGHAGSYEGLLASIIEDPTDTEGPPILIKIDTVYATDYYLTYNRKEGFNSETVEGGNQVTVVSQGGEGSALAESSLLAKLSAVDSFLVSNIDISVISISSGRANIKICIENGCDKPLPSKSSKGSKSRHPKGSKDSSSTSSSSASSKSYSKDSSSKISKSDSSKGSSSGSTSSKSSDAFILL